MRARASRPPGLGVVLLAAAVAVLTAPAALAAQAGAEEAEVRYRSALSAAESATAMVRGGRIEEAFALLGDALDRCPLDADDLAACRRVALYSLGYAHQLAADVRPSERETLLAGAADYFRDVLAEDPGYEAARLGLVQAYRRIGAREEQESVLRGLAEDDPDGRYHRILGDWLREAERPAEAAAAYGAAAERAPGDPEPRRRLVTLYASADLPVEELEPLLEAWSIRFPDLAARGWQLVMRRRYPRDPLAAAEGLARWLEARDALDQVGPGLVAEIPEDWGAPPFATLRAFLLDPAEAELAGWWRETPERRDAAAAAARDLGAWSLAEGDAATAERVWVRGRDLAPEPWPSWLDLTTDLALLYDRVPSLDPDSAKFDRLENQLFVGKGRAIGRRDHEAMLRFHRTLGMIYARRGVWTSRTPARNAVFQLEHALQAAEAARGETGIHRPLPEVRRHLAEALLGAGDTASARRVLADAGVAHLEVDDLSGARELLARARGPGATRETRRSVATLEAWLGVRRRTATALASGGPGRCEPTLLDDARSLTAPPGVAEEAAIRMRFRTLVDCAAAEAGRPEEGSRRTAADAATLAAEALEEVLDRGTPLVGIADLSRLEDARRLVYGGFGQGVERVRLRASVDGPAAGVVPLALAGDARGAYLEVGSDALTAARIVRATDPAAGSLRLRLTDGEVTVLGEHTGSAEVVAALREVSGVRGVRVRPGG